MTVCVNGLTDAPGVPTEEVFKGVFDMVAINRQGRPVPIDPTYQNQETRS